MSSLRRLRLTVRLTRAVLHDCARAIYKGNTNERKTFLRAMRLREQPYGHQRASEAGKTRLVVSCSSFIHLVHLLRGAPPSAVFTAGQPTHLSETASTPLDSSWLRSSSRKTSESGQSPASLLPPPLLGRRLIISSTIWDNTPRGGRLRSSSSSSTSGSTRRSRHSTSISRGARCRQDRTPTR